MMQALERAAAVFCTACICAELLSRFVGQGWGQKCIKAVAGLYILVVFADALPGAKAQFAALELPQVPAVSVGSLEDAVLAQTAEELSRTLEERCLSEAGVSLRLNISLSRTAEGVEAAEVQIVPRDAVTASQKRAIETLLEGQLQLGPECIKWNSPSGWLCTASTSPRSASRSACRPAPSGAGARRTPASHRPSAWAQRQRWPAWRMPCSRRPRAAIWGRCAFI